MSKNWRKKFWKELVKPENVAREVTLSIIVLIFGLFISYIFNFLIVARPQINIDCIEMGGYKWITVTNSGNKPAYDIEVRGDSTDRCELVMSVGQTNYKGAEFFNITLSPQLIESPKKDRPFKFEILTGGPIIAPGDGFSFYCPKESVFKISLSGENFGEVTKIC